MRSALAIKSDVPLCGQVLFQTLVSSRGYKAVLQDGQNEKVCAQFMKCAHTFSFWPSWTGEFTCRLKILQFSRMACVYWLWTAQIMQRPDTNRHPEATPKVKVALFGRTFSGTVGEG